MLHAAVAGSAGIGALTMRSIAKQLGVKPMALCHHFANKDAITSPSRRATTPDDGRATAR